MSRIMLEVLHKSALGKFKGSIVLVHGAWHGAWCWEDNFLPYYAEQAYDVYALSLSGHGGSTSHKNLTWLTVQDYVEDVWSVVKDIKGVTYLIGHSMGGYVVQKFLEKHGPSITKAVLIASVPSNGVVLKPIEIIKAMGFWSFMRMNLMLDLYQCVNTTGKVRTVCFTPEDAEELVDFTARRVKGESFLAYLEMLNKKFIRPKSITTPILVVSAGKDWFFPPVEQQVLVDTYQAHQLMYLDKPHNLFATEGWEQVAADIQRWLEVV